MQLRSAIITLCFLGVLVFANTLGNPFVHDDVVFILQNPQIRDLKNLGDVFSFSSFAPSSVAYANPYYRPVLDIVYRLEYFLFGVRPAGYHLVNIALHVANAVMVLLIMSRLTGRLRNAWAIAIVFLLHPVQTESVACIAGISNLLFLFFVLLAFLHYLRLAESRQDMDWATVALHYAATLVFFGIALFVKEQAIVFPLVIMFYEYCFPMGGAASQKRDLGWRLRLIGLVIVAGGYLLWRKLVLGGFITALVPNVGEFFLRLRTMPAMVVDYLRVVFWPLDLHYYRSQDILAAWQVPVLIFVGIGIAGWLLWRTLPRNRQGLFVFGLGWFVAALLPVMAVPLVHEYSWIAAFEHFLYMPFIGLLLSLVTAGDHWMEKIFRQDHVKMKNSIFALAVLAMSLMTVQQNRVWAGEVPLFERAAKYQPRIGRVRLLLAKAYYFNNETRKARHEFQVSRDIMQSYLGKVRDEKVRPFYKGFLKESWIGIGACEQSLGRFDEALNAYQGALELDPQDDSLRNVLGVLWMQVGQWQKAEDVLSQALQKDPDNAQVLSNLGVCQASQEKWEQAQESFLRALRIAPDLPQARQNYEYFLLQRKQNP